MFIQCERERGGRMELNDVWYMTFMCGETTTTREKRAYQFSFEMKLSMHYWILLLAACGMDDIVVVRWFDDCFLLLFDIECRIFSHPLLICDIFILKFVIEIYRIITPLWTSNKAKTMIEKEKFMVEILMRKLVRADGLRYHCQTSTHRRHSIQWMRSEGAPER